MSSKKQEKTSFSELVMMIAGIILLYAGLIVLLSLFIFGIIMIISGLFADASVLEKIINIFAGLILVGLGVAFFKYQVLNKSKPSKKAKSHKYTWLKTYGLLGLFVLAFAASLPNAIYWTGSAIEANRIKNLGFETTAQVTIDTGWSYPLVLVSGIRSIFVGKPTNTDSASVSFAVGDKTYSAHTMVEHVSKKGTAQEVSVWYNPQNPEQVATASLLWESTLQTVLFGALSLIFGAASVFYVRSLSKTKNTTQQ